MATTEELKRRMALAICPELGTELEKLKMYIKHYQREIEVLTAINKDYSERNAMLRETLNDQLELFNSIMEAKDEDAPSDAFEQILGKSKEELEETLSDPNGKLVFK